MLKISTETKMKILCGSFEKIYTEEYMPALIDYNKATGGKTSEEFFENNLKSTNERYKELY